MAAATSTRDGQTALALRLAKHLAPSPSAHDGANNVAFSLLSIHAALALAAAGARGDTLTQLLAFLGAPSATELADFGRRLADRVLVDRPGSDGPRVLFGGGVWVDSSHGELTDVFRDVAMKSYKCEARLVSFTKEPEKVVNMINEWVKKATNNLIDTIICLSDINAATDLVLANAVYFKGAWRHPFQPYSTTRGNFYLLDGHDVEAMFMQKLNYWLRVACMDGLKVLKLPYDAAADGSTQYSMFIFLPDAHDGIATMTDVVTLSPAFLYGVLAEMKEMPVSLQLPRFEISFSWADLKEDLQRLGLSLLFSPAEADLRGMCKWDGDADDSYGGSRRPTFLSKVAHRAVVKVNQSGTEAVAVTLCLHSGGGPPPDLVEFIADHLFTFFIMEERSRVIVFAGHGPPNDQRQDTTISN